MPETDGSLARACQGGDQEAFRQLVLRHRREVFGVARAVVLCPDEAEDVTQEAFLCAHRAMSRYDPARSFRTWLRAITVNCAVSALRRKRRKRAEPADLAEMPTPACGPDDQVARLELGAQVRQAIGRLPLRQRLAITLFSLDGLDLAATAETMGCSVGTLKSHLHRAREKLALALSDYVEGIER